MLSRIRVLGRMSPNCKVALVKNLQQLGRYVSMCGDGGNDSGALRSAHVGVALTTGDASIVASFSSGENTSLFRLVEVLREGRACLMTSPSCYSFYVNYSLTIVVAKTVMIL